MGLLGVSDAIPVRTTRASERHILRTWAKGMVRTRPGDLGAPRTRGLDRGPRAPRGSRRPAPRARPILATHAPTAVPASTPMLPLLREAWLDRLGVDRPERRGAGAPPRLRPAGRARHRGHARRASSRSTRSSRPSPILRTYDSAPPTVRTLWDIHGARADLHGPHAPALQPAGRRPVLRQQRLVVPCVRRSGVHAAGARRPPVPDVVERGRRAARRPALAPRRRRSARSRKASKA